jgi:hypothetical protein
LGSLLVQADEEVADHLGSAGDLPVGIFEAGVVAHLAEIAGGVRVDADSPEHLVEQLAELGGGVCGECGVWAVRPGIVLAIVRGRAID